MPLPLDELVPGEEPWEIEVGFGRGKYLLARAAAQPRRRLLGLEVAGEWYREVARKLRRRGHANLILLRGEALYLFATVLAGGFAESLHVYFPDPWPKSHHLRRRLFSPATLDLLLRPLAPGGRLLFATDFAEYGEAVAELLESHPALQVARRPEPWPDGARTHYEAKYLAEGRPIVRLEARLLRPAEPLPEARPALAVAPRGEGRGRPTPDGADS